MMRVNQEKGLEMCNKTGGGVYIKERTTGMTFIRLFVLAALAALIMAGCSNDSGSDDDPKVPATWTTATIETSADIAGIAYGQDVFVAVASAGTTAGSAEIFSSTDGINWTKETSALGGVGNHYVYFFKDTGKFLVVDRRGSSSDNGLGGKWATSPNGKEWTNIPGIADVATAGGGAYGNSKAVIGSSSGNVIVSSDFTNWTSTAVTNTVGNIRWVNSVAFGNGKFVIGGGGGNIEYSDDASEWTQGEWATDTNVFGSNFINQIIFNGDRFLAVGGNPGVAATSLDGVTWTQTGDIKLNATTDGGYAGYGPGVLIATWQGAISYSTNNGSSWTLVDSAKTKFDTNTIRAIAYGAGKFVMVGDAGTIAYSIPE
jgi:hypothetical protein